jgi:hypothetical protein
MYFCAHVAQNSGENFTFRMFKAIFFWVIAGRWLMTFPQNFSFLGNLIKNKITEIDYQKNTKLVWKSQNSEISKISILRVQEPEKYSKFWNLTSWGCSSYKFRLKKVKIWVWLSNLHPRTNMTAFLVTILGSRNIKRTQNFEIWYTY